MLPQRVLYYGRDEPLPQQVPLRAGPLSLIYEDGDLRYIKLNEHEILRRIYVAVRDRNWGTVLPRYSNVQMEIGEASFRITYEVENRQGEIDFSWKGTITGEADGTIRFTMDGVARSTFWRNRIGFCVLHPAECAGAPAVVEHVDGTTERGTLPVYIVPDQPVPPFAEMQALAHQVCPGVWAEVRFSGDIFEMEDQRNWTDASYKSFCTPLRLPYPVEIKAGTRVVQSVTLRLRAEQQGMVISSLREAGKKPLTLSLDHSAPALPLPPIGLGTTSAPVREDAPPLTERQLAQLAALRLSHLRVDLPLSTSGYIDRLRCAAAEATLLGVGLDVALLLSDNAEEELQYLKGALAEVKPPVRTWLVYPARELFKGGSPTERMVRLARAALADSSARFAAGTNADLIFLLRTPPPLSLLDLVTFAITPQVHAFDNASLVETLATQGVAVASARQLADGLPVMVSPVTLKMRFNPYATGPEQPTPAGELPAQVDVRQMSLFGAGWTVGSIKYLAQARVASLTYYETVGWRGIMEHAHGSLLPDKFRSLPGAVFPMYHVFADIGEFAGGQVIPTRSSDRMLIDGLALRKGKMMRLLLANLGCELRQVRVEGLAREARVRCLDETNAEEAMVEPENFRQGQGEILVASDNALNIKLLPYGVARIDCPADQA